MHREVKIFDLNRFRERQRHGQIGGVDLQGVDGGIQIAADRSSLESDGDLAKPKVEGERFHVQGFNERPERSVESHRQVVGLNDRADVHRWTVAEMDRRQQKFEVIDGVFDRFRGRFVAIGQFPPSMETRSTASSARA